MKNKRIKKKRLKAKYPHCRWWKKPSKDRKHRLHKCPVCGEPLRRGCFNACRDCYWVLEYRKALDGLLKDASLVLAAKGARLTWSYYEYAVYIKVTMSRECDIQDVRTRTGLDRVVNGPVKMTMRSRAFCSSCTLSLMELQVAYSTKDIVMHQLLEMFREVQKEADAVIDKNMKAFAIDGTFFPVQGNWRDRHG
jgi:hypothetical protein